MQKQGAFIELCKARGQDEAAVERSVVYVRECLAFLKANNPAQESYSIRTVEQYIADLLEKGQVSEELLVALARYFMVTNTNKVAIRLLAYLLPIGVLPTMVHRLGVIEGDVLAQRVLDGVKIPAVGSPPEAYPQATTKFVESLVGELGVERAERILTCNVHEIPESAFSEERERLAGMGSIDEWLIDYHARQVETLAMHAARGTLWFEQRITSPVVEFVRSNQEILGGVRVGKTIYVTKIPYDPDSYLLTNDPFERRRLACHCPLAASSITEDGATVPPTWCACSAGYTKFIFDVAFGKETMAHAVSTVLAGDHLCRFAITIPDDVLARYS